MKVKIETCKFVPASQVVPKAWQNWFWELFSEDAPFTWGDNNRSMITPEQFADHAKECLEFVDDEHIDGYDPQDVNDWLAEIEKLGKKNVLIDMEN